MNIPRRPRRPPAHSTPSWEQDTASDHIRTVMHVQTRLADPQEVDGGEPVRAREPLAPPRAGTHWMLVGLYWLFVLCVIVALYKWSRA